MLTFSILPRLSLFRNLSACLSSSKPLGIQLHSEWNRELDGSVAKEHDCDFAEFNSSPHGQVRRFLTLVNL